MHTFEHAGGRAIGSAGHAANLVRGKWTSIEQEVVMNNPGLTDGVVRVWANGKLAFERTDAVLRKTDEPLISSVLTEVLARPKTGTTTKPAAIWITPYELKW